MISPMIMFGVIDRNTKKLANILVANEFVFTICEGKGPAKVYVVTCSEHPKFSTEINEFARKGLTLRELAEYLSRQVKLYVRQTNREEAL